MFEDLKIIYWPDPRLTKSSTPVETLNGDVHALVQRMLMLMREARGVGLAAPQVGQNLRLFVMNHTGKPEDDRVIINPVLSDPEGEEENEEGCLSLPNLNVKVLRAKSISLAAVDMDGRPIQMREAGYIARIWQHEFDHLNGTLLTDRMGPVARLANRRTLKELETKYLEAHPEAVKKAKKRV